MVYSDTNLHIYIYTYIIYLCRSLLSGLIGFAFTLHCRLLYSIFFPFSPTSNGFSIMSSFLVTLSLPSLAIRLASACSLVHIISYLLADRALLVLILSQAER